MGYDNWSNLSTSQVYSYFKPTSKKGKVYNSSGIFFNKQISSDKDFVNKYVYQLQSPHKMF